MRLWKKILLTLAVLLAAIQFIRPARNISMGISANDIALHYRIPDTVQGILKRSCYDCHSNNTVYPWYDNIQPVGWWLQYHVNHGKHGLNFSEFASYTPEKQAKKLKNITEEIKQDGMPLDSYLWIHGYARLSPEEKTWVMAWADSLRSVVMDKK
jgi:hypothetical protein